MNPIAFMLDENIPPSVVNAIRAAEPAIILVHVGQQADAPAKGTLDPGLLVFAEEHGLALVTFDKRTMTGHVCGRPSRGRSTYLECFYLSKRKWTFRWEGGGRVGNHLGNFATRRVGGSDRILALLIHPGSELA
jgi:hypothetical protein